MRLELRHLRIVCTIADAGSVTKAAASLGLAQPALTAQLQRIERILGGRLFDRDRQGARPTALGELVLARARVLLPAVEGLTEEASRLAQWDGAAVAHRIGAVNGPILGGLIRRISAAYPHASLTTHPSWHAGELVELLAAGRLDYALVGVCGDASPPAATAGRGGRGLRWRVVAADPVFVLLPADHRLAAHSAVDLRKLAETPWSVTPGDGCFETCLAKTCARAGFPPPPRYEGDVRACVELVEAGAAVALCQGSFRPPPGLVSVPIVGNPLSWRHLLGWHPEAPAAHRAEQVVDYARESYLENVERLPRYTAWLRRWPQFGAARSTWTSDTAEHGRGDHPISV